MTIAAAVIPSRSQKCATSCKTVRSLCSSSLPTAEMSLVCMCYPGNLHVGSQRVARSCESLALTPLLPSLFPFSPPYLFPFSTPSLFLPSNFLLPSSFSPGANRDCFLLNPQATSTHHMNMFRFLGILMGIAIRTGSPLALLLAEPVWKQLAGTLPSRAILFSD